MSTPSEIKKYWQQSPPFKGEGKPGTREWSESITDHRHKVIPYIKDFVDGSRWYKKRVLEIGYGAGSDLLEFAKGGATVYGVDITAKSKKITLSRFKAEEYPEPTLTVYDGKNLPFPSNAFDLVYSCGVLHHSPYMDRLLSEIYRILVPGGMFKAMLYNRNSLLYNYSILYRATREEALAYNTGKKPKIDAANHQAVTSLWSEFRTGCPLTNVYSEADIKDRLQFFSHVSTTCDYFVFDDFMNGVRKVDGRTFTKDRVSTTGFTALDKFFSQMGNTNDGYRGVKELNEKKYGWHLLVEAYK